MKTKVMIIICSFLLIGIVGAGFFPYLSNSVEASVEVKEPVFYLDSGNMLSVNEDSGNTGAPNKISPGETEIWETEELNLNEFYNFEAKFFLRAKSNESEILKMSFGYTNFSDSENEICSREINITSTTLHNYENIPVCSGSEIKNVKKLYWKFSGECDSCEYGISKGEEKFSSRIEISKQ